MPVATETSEVASLSRVVRPSRQHPALPPSIRFWHIRACRNGQKFSPDRSRGPETEKGKKTDSKSKPPRERTRPPKHTGNRRGRSERRGRWTRDPHTARRSGRRTTNRRAPPGRGILWMKIPGRECRPIGLPHCHTN